MSSCDFYFPYACRALQSLYFPKRAISGICVRVPGKIDCKILGCIEKSATTFGLNNSLIPECEAVFHTSFMDDPEHYFGKFTYTALSKSKLSITKLTTLSEQTKQHATRIIADNFKSVFFEETYSDCRDLFYIGFLTHRNWAPEDRMFDLLEDILKARPYSQSTQIPGSGGYDVVTAHFAR